MAGERTLSKLLSMVTLDDIFVIMLTKNLKNSRVRASYQILKEFFNELRFDPKEWASVQVREVLNQVCDDDIDHMLTRVLGLSGLCSFNVELGNDFCHMNEQQIGRAVKYYDRLGAEDRLSFDEITKRYGARLARLES